MNDKVKELVKRVRLTDKEIKEAISNNVAKSKYSKYKVPISIHPRDKTICQAQVNKVFKEDLALINREKELPSSLTDHIPLLKEILDELGFTHSIIPLVETIKEIEG